MKLSDPAVRHALIAALVIGAVAVIVFAVMPPHVAKTPLQGAQLAGTRGIRLEGEQPVPRFDDQRAPIVVAPPAQGQWSAFAVGMDQRVPLTIVVEPVDDVQRIRIQAPLPIGRWDLVLEDDARQTRWPVRFAKVPEPSAVIARLTVEAEALDVADRPAFWATVSAPAGMDRVSVKVAEARAWIAAGNLQAAAGAYETAAADAGAIGWISEQAGRLRAAAWAKLCVREFEATHALLDRAQRVIAITHDAWAQARVDYLRGCALRETGMFRDATAHLRQSGRVARQFADGRLTTTITNELATLYSDLGQYDAALALLQETPDAGEARGRRLNIRGWIAARAFKKDRSRWSQVRADLEGSLDHLTAPAERAIALTNLAAMDLQEGQLDAARDRLSELAKLPDDFAALHARLFEAEVARRTGEIDAAVRMYSALLKTAQTGFNDELIWQAALGLHRVARLRDRPADAQEWLTAAFAALEVRGRRAAVSNARATLLADRDDLIEASADFHLANGDATNALASLDATRAWVLRDLDARLRIERLPESEKSAWYGAQRTYQAARSALDDRLQSCARRPGDERAACDATVDGLRAAVQSAFDRLYAVLDRAAPSALKDARLPRIAPRRALFTAVALADKTVAFWMQGAQVTAAETRIDDPLAPFAHKLTGLDHLYVVGAVGLNLRKVVRDVLAESATTWSELPFAGLLAQPQIEARGAPVVIADPASDLQHARAEGRAVHAHLGGAMLLGEQATRSATLQALSSGARVLHFAGHGALDADSPWQAHLVLANDERLTLADLLVARPILGIVVLSGCETGVRGALSSQHAVGLPDAFLLSGAQAVIATDRVVPDADARAFVDHFYKHPDWATRPAAAFHSAVRALRAAGNPIWTAFRLMGRA